MQADQEYAAIAKVIRDLDLNIIKENELKLGKEIGRGGQGKVVLAKYQNTNVVVKLLEKPKKNAFEREVWNTYKFRHPNIPKFLGIYEEDNQFGIVIEHWDGKDLSKIILSEKQGFLHLTLIQKLDYLIQLASVIEFLHSHNWIHRDLKTDNIIIDHLGSLKVLDFGISLEGRERWINYDSPDFAWTPNYCAPEIDQQLKDISKEDDAEEEEEEEEDNRGPDEKGENEVNKMKNESENFNIDQHQDLNRLINEDLLKLAEMKWSITQQKRIKYSLEKKKSLNYNWLTSKLEVMGHSEKAIKITNKYDVWTFGLIMSYLMTQWKPWEREALPGKSKPEIPKVKIIIMNILLGNIKEEYPIGKFYPLDECQKYNAKFREIINRCLVFNPEQRAEIKEIKEQLLEIFNIEVGDHSRIDKMLSLKRTNKENKNINEILKDVEENKKKDIVRFNKLWVRKKVDLDMVNNLNMIANVNHKPSEERKEDTEETVKDSNALVKRINQRLQPENVKIGNTMLEVWRRSNFQNAQKMKIEEHKIFEIKTKINEASSLFFS